MTEKQYENALIALGCENVTSKVQKKYTRKTKHKNGKFKK